MVAKRIQITNRSVLHGHEFNVGTHSIFQLTEVADAKYIPEDNNPFEEPLNVGQYALWKLEDMIPEESNTPHGIIRKSARDKYLKRAQKQQEIYDSKCAKIEKIYKENDIIGVSIHSADRTHTDKKIMPCRILEIKDKKMEY